MNAIVNWFTRLPGEYRLIRHASDGSFFQGHARFELSGSQCRLTEEGVLSLPEGHRLPASRHWRWSLEGPEILEIAFDDGRIYHRVALCVKQGFLAGSASHRCAADLYQGEYRLSSSRIAIRHSVIGPAKDYRMLAVASRSKSGDYT